MTDRSRFAEPQAAKVRNDRIAHHDRTFLDDITDVGWLPTGLREEMRARYLQTRGQYFENGRRVVA